MPAPFPGDILQQRINGLGMTQLDFGNRSAGLHWVTLNRIIKGHEPIKPQYALLLGKMFSTTPNYWMHLQADWDLQQHIDNLATPTKKIHARQAAIVGRTKVFE